jgi:hypothetical protein
MPTPTTRIPCLSPFQASTLADFLSCEDYDALWMIADHDGPVVVTTAPLAAVESAKAALWMEHA